MNISDVLQSKGSAVTTIAPAASISELLMLLREYNIGAVVVTTEDTVVGIASERDIVRQLHDRGAELLHASVTEIMTAHVLTCGLADTIDSVAKTMTEQRVRHMPVLSDGRLVGLVSIGDVVKSRINQLETDREQLESYITGG